MGGDLLAWGVVANVVAETTHGVGGRETQRGLKHFAAGAKVWVLPVIWGDGGESVFVVGRHRGAHDRGYIRIVVDRRHLTDFRVRGIYSPAVLQAASAPWKHIESFRMWPSQEEAPARRRPLVRPSR